MKGIVTAIFLVSTIILLNQASAEEDTRVAMLQVDRQFYSSVKGIIDTPDPLMNLAQVMTDETLDATPYKQSRQEVLQRLVKSIDAIEDRQVGLSAEEKLQIADAALNAQERTGLDAVMMLAVARMESDFKKIVMVNPECKFGGRTIGCYADCGMTQHHIRGPKKYVESRCKQLANNVKEVFLLSAQELAHHVKWCSERSHQPWHRPLRRCVLNRYNMGPFYKTAEGCKATWGCDKIKIMPSEEYKEYVGRKAICAKQQRKCFFRSTYWERLTCFEYGARKQLRSTKNCRWCTGLSYITTFFYSQPKPDPVVPTPDPAGPANVAGLPVRTSTIHHGSPQ